MLPTPENATHGGIVLSEGEELVGESVSAREARQAELDEVIRMGTNIEQLIQELCPDGVPFLPLGELVRIRNGKDYKSYADGEIPVYGSGGVIASIDTSVHLGPSVLIPRKGSLNKLYYVDSPFWTVDTIFYTEIGEKIVPKFFYYFLLTCRLEELNQAGGVPSLTQTVLNKIAIPVPPVEVQEEIVRILDLFTTLEAELEAELEKRRIQYAHYRDTLLSFNSLSSFERERERVFVLAA